MSISYGSKKENLLNSLLFSRGGEYKTMKKLGLYGILALGLIGAHASADEGLQLDTGTVIASEYFTFPQPMSIAEGDVDGDGDADLMVANAAGIKFLENDGKGKYTNRGVVFKSDNLNYDIDVGIATGDFDGDGVDEVAYVAPAGLTVLSYQETPLGEAPGSWEEGNSEKSWKIIAEKYLGLRNPKVGVDVKISDFDRDGDLDIIVGTSQGIIVFKQK